MKQLLLNTVETVETIDCGLWKPKILNPKDYIWELPKKHQYWPARPKVKQNPNQKSK